MANYLEDLEILELSGVDRPAQEPALVALAKRNNEQDTENKEFNTMADPNKENKELDELKKSLEEVTKSVDAVKEENEVLKADLEKANKVAGLSGDEKAHYDSLSSDADKDAFLAKSADEKAEEIAKASDDENSEFVMIGDLKVNKNDETMKEVVKRMIVAEDEVKAAKIEKAAKENFENLPLTDESKVILQKGVNAVDKSEAETLMAELKKFDSKFFESIGAQSVGTSPDAVVKGVDDDEGNIFDAVEKRTKEILEENPDMDKSVAKKRALDEVFSN